MSKKLPENLNNQGSESSGFGLGNKNKPEFTLRSRIPERPSPAQKEADAFYYAIRDARQSYRYGKVAYEMYKSRVDFQGNIELNQQDPETGFVQFHSQKNKVSGPTRFPDEIGTLPTQNLIDKQENEQQVDYVNQTKYFVRINDDNSVTFKVESKIFEQPIVIYEDLFDQVQDLLQERVEQERIAKLDPFAAQMNKLDKEYKTLSRESTYITIKESENDDGVCIVNMEKETHDVSDDFENYEEHTTDKYKDEHLSSDEAYQVNQANKVLSFIRTNLHTTIRHLLDKAVSSEDSDHYQQLFTLESRRELLKMIHEEIRILHQENRLPSNEIVFDVSLTAAFQSDLIMPQIEYYFSKIQLDEATQQYVLKTVHLNRDLVGSEIERKMYDDGFNSPEPMRRTPGSPHELSKLAREAGKVWRTWKKSRMDTMGEQAHLQDLYGEFLELEAEAGVEVDSVPADAQIARGYIAFDGSHSGSLTTLSLREDHFYNRTGQSIFKEVRSSCEGDYDESDPDFAELVLFMRLLV